MIFNYSGGIKAITEGVASDVVDRAHETLNNLSRNLTGEIPKQSAKELISFWEYCQKLKYPRTCFSV